MGNIHRQLRRLDDVTTQLFQFVKERKIDQENAHAEWNKTESPTDIFPQMKVQDSK